MKETRLLMGMPIAVDVVGSAVSPKDIEDVFAYFQYIDDTFSAYKGTSEINAINTGKIKPEEYSEDMKTIFRLSNETKECTDGYFDIRRADGTYDPSGIVKGWAINNAAKILKDRGFNNFYIDAGGDVAAIGKNAEGKLWRVGIRDPSGVGMRVVKVVHVQNRGVATSGTYIRGQHIYNPHARGRPITEIVSLTVIGPDVYEADRFATAAFAMGRGGIAFIEQLPDFEGYSVDKKGIATMTSGFEAYTNEHA